MSLCIIRFSLTFPTNCLFNLPTQTAQLFSPIPPFLFSNYSTQVTGVDTGGGEVVFEEPITVGWVVKDREGVVCDDTCEFAFDGVCDDGTESGHDHDNEYNEYYGYYGGEDGTEGDKQADDGSHDVVRTLEVPDCHDCSANVTIPLFLNICH